MAQRTQVKEAVHRCPRASGSHARVWTTKLVRHFLSTRFGIEYCRERVRQLRYALGCRLRRRRHRHLKAKPEEQAAFRAELEALLAEWPEDWELIFVDEATVRRHPTLTAQWCVVEDVPEGPGGAMLLGHIAQAHISEVGRFLDQMHTTDDTRRPSCRPSRWSQRHDRHQRLLWAQYHRPVRRGAGGTHFMESDTI